MELKPPNSGAMAYTAARVENRSGHRDLGSYPASGNGRAGEALHSFLLLRGVPVLPPMDDQA